MHNGLIFRQVSWLGFILQNTPSRASFPSGQAWLTKPKFILQSALQ